MAEKQDKPKRVQQVYTLLVEVGRKQGDGLPEEATGAALMCYASGVDEAEAVLVGRPSGPDSPGLSQRQAVLDALGPLEVPLVLGVDVGHVPPNLPLVNGASCRVVVDARRAEITQGWG